MASNRNIDPETEDFSSLLNENRIRPVRKAQTSRREAEVKGNSTPHAVPDPIGPLNRRRPKGKKSTSQDYNFISFLKDYRTHLAVGIILCLIAFAMTVCCISFIFNSAIDQSVIHDRTITEIVQSGDDVANAGSAGGAKLAELLLVKGFGLGAFALAFYLFMIGLATMHVRRCRFWSLSFRCLFTAVAVSIIIGLLTYNREAYFHLGGEHGYYINTLLMEYTGALGAYCITVALLVILIAVFLNPLKVFMAFMAKCLRKTRKTVQNRSTIEENIGGELFKDENEDVHEGNHDSEFDIADKEVDEPNQFSGVSEETKEETIPSPDIDVFGEDNEPDTVLKVFPEIKTVVPVSESLVETAEEETVTSISTPGEPEMIIRNPSSESVEDKYVIADGDHIGLDKPYDQHAAHSSYKFPSVDLLIDRPNTFIVNEQEQAANKALIVNALRSYNIEIIRIEATIGPTVTLYEIVPEAGTKIAKIRSLEDDIAMSLAALGIRIIAPMPGKGTIGIEVPNQKPQIVSMRKVIESKVFQNNDKRLPIALGSTISNDIYLKDLAKMPHLLVAGATGQGKSVGLNCIITSLLYSKHPDELKFVLIDPKMVEFTLYQKIANQYLAKIPDEERAVITDPQKAIATLNSLCVEMDNRYELLSDAGVRSMEAYNERFLARKLNPEKGHRYMPYIVMIVDEFADLIMTAGKDVSVPICRIAQKARAVGMHMIIATQRPSTDIITGPIKANFPARIAFKTTQGIDSKTILDRPGAQRLIGRGDMLTLIDGSIERVQCAFVDTEEIEAICGYISEQPGFVEPYMLPEAPSADGASEGTAEIGATTDEFRKCALFIASQSQASITMMQRRFEIGFNKAGRFMDQMQAMGIVGPANGAKPRQVLMTPDEVARLFE